jgi:hypothetical protein
MSMKNIRPYIVVLFALIFVTTVCGCDFKENGKPFSPTPISPTPTTLRINGPRPTATPASVIGDGGLLSGEPCSPPCFWGIEPGKTTQAEVLEILTSKGIIDTCETIDQYQFAIDKGIGGWWACPSSTSIEFWKVTGVVSAVEFEITPSIELQEIVAKYGFPDAVLIVNVGSTDYPSLWAVIYYFDLRTSLVLVGEQEGVEYEILPTTLIDWVGYYDEQAFAEEIDHVVPWHGYGRYKKYMP